VAGEHRKEKEGEHCRPGLGEMVALFLLVGKAMHEMKQFRYSDIMMVGL
jgi:hypothetical protein